VNVIVVVFDKAFADSVSLSWTQIDQVERTNSVIEFSVMIRANAENVAQSVWSIVGLAEWLNVMPLRITRTVG
jgi:hypothetical protein